MSFVSNRGEPAFSSGELHLFKKVFLDLSNLNRWSVKNAYSDNWWSEILSIYNEMAELEGLPPQTSNDKVILAGTELHSTFCKERANHEIKLTQVRFSLPSRDDDLLAIFEPCPACKKKVMIFSTALLKIARIETYDLETPMEDGELKLFTEQCVKFSKGDLLTGMSLWSISMWSEFTEKYNELASANNLRQRSWSEMIQAGRGLQSEFCKQRKEQARGVIEEVHVDLQQIFGLCEFCNKRIPIFPNKSYSHSSLLIGSRAHSRVSRSRARSHFEGSRSVRQCSRSTHYDDGMVCSAERISYAVELLDSMHQRNLIDWESLYKLIHSTNYYKFRHFHLNFQSKMIWLLFPSWSCYCIFAYYNIACIKQFIDLEIFFSEKQYPIRGRSKLYSLCGACFKSLEFVEGTLLCSALSRLCLCYEASRAGGRRADQAGEWRAEGSRQEVYFRV